jgi:hypothetical protein
MKRSLVSALGVLLLSLMVLHPAPGGQPEPFTAAELDSFIRDWPRFVQWARQSRIEATADGSIPDTIDYSLETEQFLRRRGWEPERFFYVAGNSSSALLVIDARDAVATRELEQQRAIILESPHLTPAQKAEMIESIDRTIEGLLPTGSVSDIPASEIDLVFDRRQQLRRVLELDY